MGFILGGAMMIKEVIKIILCGIVVYPIGLLFMQLEGPKSDKNWFVALIIDFIVTLGLTVHAIIKNKKS